MPLDAVCLTALSNELEQRIVGMKIDKVQQPERDLLLLSLRGNGESVKLLISGGSGSARVHLTQAQYEQPQSPPMFCMLLRKHMQGARIESVNQPEHERLLMLKLDATDDMGFASKKDLVVEMLGRSTNIILTASDGMIIDCLRRVDAEMSERRQVLPGLFYRLPHPQEKPSFFGSDSDARRRLWLDAPGDQCADKWLLSTFSGLSPLICRELCSRCFGNATPRISELSAEARQKFPAAMDALCDTVASGEFAPTLLSEQGRPQDFSFMAITQYGSAYENRRFEDFSQLLEAFYTRREQADRVARRAQSLIKSIKTARGRIARKLDAQQMELKQTAERDVLRKSGDLITANLYRMKKGETQLIAQDYFDEGCPDIAIELEPLKSPQQNAQKYYKGYNRAKTAEKYLSGLIIKAQGEIEYLDSVLSELSRVEGERDISAIRRELTEAGFIRKQKTGKKEKNREPAPLSFISDAGMEILVGRNNAQNDELTLRTARRTDVWLHTKSVHGSHVILRCADTEPDDLSLSQAASLAVHYSQAREAGKTAVDYTQVRFVKKPSGALPGKVIYTDQKTIMAQGDEQLAERLKRRK